MRFSMIGLAKSNQSVSVGTAPEKMNNNNKTLKKQQRSLDEL